MDPNFQKLLPFLLFALSINLGFAQSETTIRGTVLETGGAPIEFATVLIGDAATEAALTGTTTDLEGRFSVSTDSKNFYIEISFIGFAPTVIRNPEIVDGVVELGEVTLSDGGQNLDEVVVRAERSSTEFKLDKRVFNVGKDLSNTGASALEVLNNVPSVNVSIEGAISLRGSSGVQILINGKPSILASEEGNALGTITADMIESIEVITNPSAKYEAGGTSGIINIILKKDERRGLNGSVSVNTGWPHNHSVGLSLNKRTEKFNLFSQLGVGYRELPRENENLNRDLTTGIEIFSEGTDYRNELFYNAILGADYHIDENQVLTLSGNFAYEVEDQPSDYRFLRTDADGQTLAEWLRSETTEATNPKYQYELQYKRDFPSHKDHDLIISATGSFFGKDQSSEFENTNLIGDFADDRQRTRTDFREALNTFKLDYTRPFNDKWSMETGAQYVLNDVSNDFAVTDFVDTEWVPNLDQTNVFEYRQNVFALYGTGSYEDEKWGIKLGLRAENTDLSTLLVTTQEDNQLNFTNWFPTAHTSYKITDALSMQAGYSRRIFRPRLWDLNPFFNIRNNFSIRTGNPDLLPEFTDSYEVAGIYILDQVSFNFGVYQRYTTDVIERISTFEDGISVTQPFNIGTNRATGVEFNVKYLPKKWLTLNADFNYNHFNREGTYEGTVFDFNADQWSAKLMSKLKLPADIDFEVTGQYRSGYQTIQGEVSDNLFADLGLRKKFMNGRGILNFSVRDVFASRFRESITNQENFYLYDYSRRGRFVTLGFSYGFGKGEAMEFSGRRR